ncbi:cytochrome P450 71A1-like isoform X1 [Cornus florida]|uniref:cytochrome P450 71A1-like isoform X1 n=1 Tax=Cornus florida TaxID=4283 RepID=UPI00289DD720|nr:cytochrome P450 71A1-like isoform X1 [Cornus florida]
MMTILLLFLPTLSLLCFLHQKYRNKYGANHLPPGPPGLPIIGNLHELANSAPHHYLWQLSKKYGPLMTLQLGFVPTLVVSSAKMAKEVLKTHDLEFASRPSLLGQRKLSYNGLDVAFTPYREYWREMRKICVLHLLNPKRVESFRYIREDEVSRMIKKISNFASASKLINLSEMLMSLTSAMICRIAFGKRYDDEGCVRSKFHGLLHEAQAMLGSFFLSDYFPFLGWVDKLNGMSSRADKIFKEMDLFYQEIIDERLQEESSKSEQEDILDVLLQLQKDHSFTIDLTLDHIKAVLMNIFMAGTDTSAATLVWAMTGLMKHPRTMKRVQEEIRHASVERGMVKEDDLHKLPYLKAVVKETLRLHPPSPLLLPHETTKKCNINGYEIPPKTCVYVNAWAVGRDPESWEHPEEFLPERFMDSCIDYKGQDFEFIPFGAGRRGCPGIYLGALTVELALANLLNSFDWELPPGMKKEDIDMDVLPGITMHKKNALCLLAKKYHGHVYQ